MLEELDKIILNIDLIREAYPHLSEEQCLQAKENLEGYFNVVWTIFLRLRREGRLDEVLSHSRPQDGIEPNRARTQKQEPLF